MSGTNIKVSARDGGTFDCYLALPTGNDKAVPAVVMASAVHGADADICAIADAFAAAGYIAAAPDLFWRTVPGPLPRSDTRTAERSQPRLPVIKTGEADMADTLQMVKALPQHNGKAMSMGFCFGGPYAILGPKRLGYDAGIGCHSTQMKDFLHELDGLNKPVCIIWGDQDNRAPPEVQASYIEKTKTMRNLQVHIFPGILHGYMMRGSAKAWSKPTYDFSMGKALEMLQRLR